VVTGPWLGDAGSTACLGVSLFASRQGHRPLSAGLRWAG